MGTEHRTDVRPDPVLSNIAMDYGTGGPFIYDELCPVRIISSASFKYGIFDFSPQISDENDTKMAPDGPANEATSPTITWTEALVKPYGLKVRFGDHEKAEAANPGAWERNKVRKLVNEQRMGIERELKTALDAASNATTLTGAAQWNDTGATPLIEKSIDDAKEAFLKQCGFEATDIVVPPSCWQVFKRDATIRDALKYTHMDLLNGRGGLDDTIFGLKFHVPGAIRNTANPGATVSVSRIWSDDKVYLLYVDPSVASDPEAVSAAFLAQSETLPGMTWAASTWRPTERDQKWDWYLVEQAHKLITVGACIRRLDDVLE